MTTHAKLSPSARHRWGACPASVRVSAQYPEGTRSSPAAIDGTHSHTLLEYCIRNKVAPKNTVGALFHDHDGQFSVDAERAKRVAVAFDYVMGLVEKDPSAKLYTEVQVNPFHLVQRDDMLGTIDVCIITDSVLEVIDYKDGVNPVEVVDNPQLEQYLVGMVAGLMLKGEKIPATALMTIIQPKASIKGAPVIAHHAMTISEVIGRIAPKLIEEGKATDDPASAFIPGEKQCSYCPHRANCSAATAHALGKAGIKFDNKEADDPKEIIKEVLKAEPDKASDDELREIIEAAPLLRKMVEVAEAEATRRIMSGHTIPGLKMVRGNGRREWAKGNDEVAETLVRMGVPKSEVWKTTLISPAGTDNLRWTKTKRDGTVETKELSERQRGVLTSELIRKTEGKLTIVSEADSRPAVDFGNIGEMFGAVPAATPAPPAATPEAVPDWLNS